jgi:hypothetical protein
MWNDAYSLESVNGIVPSFDDFSFADYRKACRILKSTHIADER